MTGDMMTGFPSPDTAAGRRLPQRLTALLAVAVLALAGALASTQPARAQNDDLVRFLLGAAAIAVIVRAFDANARITYIDHWTLPGACLETVRVRGRHVDVYNRGCLQRAGYRNLPHHCQVSLRTHHGRRTGYEASCLYRAGYRAEGHWGHRPYRGDRDAYPGDQLGRLPGFCALTYRRGHQRLDGYDGQCLRNAGLHRLPRHCALNTTTGGQIYDARCLEQAGYRGGRR